MPTIANANAECKREIAAVSSTVNIAHYCEEGGADCGADFQAAIDAAHAGSGRVFIPEGTWAIGQATDNGQTLDSKIKGGLKIYDGMMFIGEGDYSEVFVRADEYNNTLWSKMCPFISSDHVNGTSNVIFRDFAINGNRDNISVKASSMEGIDIILSGGNRCSDILYENLLVKNVVNEALDMNTGFDRWTVRNSRFIDCGGDAVHADNDQFFGVFDSNYVNNCGNTRALVGTEYGGIQSGSQYGKTTNNFVINCIRGIVTGTTSYNTIANNSIQNFAFNNVLPIASFSFPNATTVRITTTSPEHSGEHLLSNSDSVTLAGVTITSGNDVNGARTVSNVVNRFTFDITFTHGGGDYTGGTATGPATFATEFGIYISGNNNIVIGNTLFQTSAYYEKGICIYHNLGAGAQIVNNSMVSDYRSIQIDTTGNDVIANNHIGGTNVQQSIQINAGEHMISGNVMAANKPSSSARGAIEIAAGATGCVVSGNYIPGAQAGRAILSKADNTTITGNSIAGSSSGGTEIELTADNCSVVGNRIAGGSSQAILIGATCDKTLVTSNNCVGAAAAVTDGGTNTTAANNTT